MISVNMPQRTGRAYKCSVQLRSSSWLWNSRYSDVQLVGLSPNVSQQKLHIFISWFGLFRPQLPCHTVGKLWIMRIYWPYQFSEIPTCPHFGTEMIPMQANETSFGYTLQLFRQIDQDGSRPSFRDLQRETNKSNGLHCQSCGLLGLFLMFLLIIFLICKRLQLFSYFPHRIFLTWMEQGLAWATRATPT